MNLQLSESTISLLTNKEVAVIYPLSQDRHYLKHIVSLLQEKELGNLKIHFHFAAQIPYPTRKSKYKLFQSRKDFHAYRDIIEELSQLFPRRITFSKLTTGNQRYKQKKLRKLEDLKNSDFKYIFNSIRSVFATHVTKTDLANYRLFFFKRLAIEMATDYIYAYRMTENLVQENTYQTVIFLNGRYPSQSGIRDYLEREKIPFLSCEWGAPLNKRIFLEPWQVQQFDELQNRHLEIRREWNDDQRTIAIDFATEWLNRNATEPSFNRFLREGKEYIASGDSKIATIFTSCPEEDINNLGQELNGWKNQKDAFSHVIPYLLQANYKVIVRIHPNSINKAWVDLIQLVEALMRFNVEIVYPWDEISSYQILSISNLVGTWASTIGLEAAARGIPTFYLGGNPYSSAAIIPLVSPKTVSTVVDLEKGKSDIENAKFTIFQYQNFGYRASEDNFKFIDGIVENIWNDYKSTGRVKSSLRIRKRIALEKLNSLNLIRNYQFIRPADLFGILNLLGVRNNLSIFNVILKAVIKIRRKLQLNE